jgi:hypothetical protein
MSGRRRRAPAFAGFAILMALLVPARAIAVCCLDGQPDVERTAVAHGAASHHGHDVMGDGGLAFTFSAPAPDCDQPADVLPLLRERSRADLAPGAGPAALPTGTILVAYVSPAGMSESPDPSAAQVGRARVSHLLRL